MTRICVRKLCTWIHIARKDVCESITTVVAWKKDIDDTVSKRLDIVDEARTSLVEDKDDRLACLCKCLHEITLILGKGKVCKVARSFAIRVLTDTCKDHVRIARSPYSLLDLRSVLLLIAALSNISDSLLEDYILCAELIAYGLVNSIILTCISVSPMSLPCVAPTTVEATH